ncbi:MAG: hypothetical protein NWS40_04645 [Crocinitomicaceae bacterium]|jgi:hypothetical protein|nr:hypothetical protein [Crocinitomicaceae bacterium]MDP4865457.1 hypothetical protein [Crocinitomicaceae bacterium]MDP5009696.1 hypothetical protein [Crocinitomicaceae bacterium]
MGRIDGTWNLEYGAWNMEQSDALRLLSGVEVSEVEVNMEHRAWMGRIIDFFSKIGNAS